MGPKVSSPLWDPCPFSKYDPETLLEQIKNIQSSSASLNGNQKLRIVICACGNNGKSASINNMLAALSGEYNQTANTGGLQTCHVTQRYIEYRMLTGAENDSPYLLCDTPGLRERISESQQMLETETIKAVIQGKFSSYDEINYDELTVEDLKRMKEKQGMADCVIFVIDSTIAKFGSLDTDEGFQSLKCVLQFVQRHDIKTTCLLTKCDRLDESVKHDVRQIYYSALVEDARTRLAAEFGGFPNDRIFPIVNYTQMLTPTRDMRIQSLFALRHIMGDILSRLRRRVLISTNNH